MASVDEILVYFAQAIERELGIIYSAHNYFQLQNRLEQIAASRNMPNLEALHDEVKRGMTIDLKTQIMDLATNNETSFFRDARIFKAVENVMLNNPGRELRNLEIWSAASSSGQEALSIAMMIQEWNERSAKKTDFRICATDISSRILNKAREARYSGLEIGRGLPENMKSKYFQTDGEDGWRAKSILREKMEFRSVNLKEPFRFDKKFDLIFCRNVLIYQAVEAKKEILSRVTEVLQPGGFLILGAGESVYGLSEAFEQVEADGSILYRKKDALARAS